MSDELKMLSDFEVRALARDGWRRQAAQDAALERRLLRDRVSSEVEAQAARRAKSLGASQRGLFDFGVTASESETPRSEERQVSKVLAGSPARVLAPHMNASATGPTLKTTP